jgi:hypothetical protein
MKYVFNSKGENAICRLWKERQYCFRAYKGNVHFIFRFFYSSLCYLQLSELLLQQSPNGPYLVKNSLLLTFSLAHFVNHYKGVHTHTLSLFLSLSLSLSLSLLEYLWAWNCQEKKKNIQGLLSFFYSITSRLLYKETFGDEKY